MQGSMRAVKVVLSNTMHKIKTMMHKNTHNAHKIINRHTPLN